MQRDAHSLFDAAPRLVPGCTSRCCASWPRAAITIASWRVSRDESLGWEQALETLLADVRSITLELADAVAHDIGVLVRAREDDPASGWTTCGTSSRSTPPRRSCARAPSERVPPLLRAPQPASARSRARQPARAAGAACARSSGRCRGQPRFDAADARVQPGRRAAHAARATSGRRRSRCCAARAAPRGCARRSRRQLGPSVQQGAASARCRTRLRLERDAEGRGRRAARRARPIASWSPARSATTSGSAGRRSRTREEFCRQVGLPADRPFVLYVVLGAVLGQSRRGRFVRRWIESLRASDGSGAAHRRRCWSGRIRRGMDEWNDGRPLAVRARHACTGRTRWTRDRRRTTSSRCTTAAPWSA